MRNKYTIKIDVENKFFRFADSDKPLEREESYSNDTITGVYLPYVKDFSFSENKVEIKGEASIPTISLSVYDPSKEIYNEFRGKDLDYETSTVKVHKLLGDGIYKRKFKGYISDVSDGGNFVEFEIRKSKNQNLKNVFDRFSYDSFQKIVSRYPADVQIDPVWSASDELGWKLAKGYNDPTDSDPFQVAYSRRFITRLKSRQDGSSITTGNSTIKVHVNNGEPGYGNTYPKWDYDATQDKVHLSSTPTLFPKSPSSDREIAIGWPNSEKFEKIKYSSLTINTINNGDTTEYVFSVDSSTIDYEHDEELVVIRLMGNTAGGHEPNDHVWMDSGGKVPVDKNNNRINDPNLDAGFINIGGTYSNRDGIFNNSFGKLHIFPLYRYELEDDPYNNYLNFKIHNNPLDDTNHDLYVDHPATNYPLVQMDLGRSKGEDDPQDKVYKAKFRWAVRNLEFNVNNMFSKDLKKSLNNFDDKLRGIRVDLQGEFNNSDIVREGGLDKSKEDYKEVNKNLVNNATGKFAVVASSEVYWNSNEEEYRLKLDFDLPARLNNDWKPIQNGVKGEIDNADHYQKVERDKNLSDQFMNHMLFEPNYDDLSALRNDSNSHLLKIESARRFFLNKKFRYFLNPVPRSAKDLGKVFPICYGYLQKVPMLHTVSKMRFERGDDTAGDDKYVYASHPCDIDDEMDIQIYYKDENRDESPSKDNISKDTPGITNTRTYYEMARNPFPKIVENHYEEVVDVDDDSKKGRIHSVGRLEHPYHKLKKMETIEGDPVYGVQLQGHKWNPNVGKLDARFPVRNGFGKSTLYATFGGYRSSGKCGTPSGHLVEHPLDIIYHFVMTYGRATSSGHMAEDLFDRNNIDKIKSKTRKYKFSVYINEEVNLFDFISKICKQAGLYWYFDGDKVRFSLGEKQNVDYTKPIQKGLNVVGDIQQESEGYKDFYNEVTYRFRRDYMGEGFKKEVVYNGSNSDLCARASKVLADKNKFEVDADWVNSPYVAKDVARRYVERLCRQRFRYTVQVKNLDGIDSFGLLDYVPITDSEYNLDKTPVLVTSVQDEEDYQTLSVVEFRDR